MSNPDQPRFQIPMEPQRTNHADFEGWYVVGVDEESHSLIWEIVGPGGTISRKLMVSLEVICPPGDNFQSEDYIHKMWPLAQPRLKK